MGVSSITNWIQTNEASPDGSLEMTASIMGFLLSLNDFATAQGGQITQLNNQISALANSINLLRSYTPQGDQGTTTTPNTIDMSSAPWNTPNADSDLYTIISSLQSNDDGTAVVSLFTEPGTNTLYPAGQSPMTWSYVSANLQSDSFSQAGMQALDQNLQASSTQLTTQVQTLTAEASQTTQMSNTMSQAASSTLANWLQMLMAGAKA